MWWIILDLWEIICVRKNRQRVIWWRERLNTPVVCANVSSINHSELLVSPPGISLDFQPFNSLIREQKLLPLVIVQSLIG